MNTAAHPVYVIAARLASPCSGLSFVGFLVPFVSSLWNILLLLFSFYGIVTLTGRILSSFHGWLAMRVTAVTGITSSS